MASHKVVNGVITPLTDIEKAELVEERKQWESEAPDRARSERDEILSINVDPIVSNVLRWNDMTDAKRAEWTQYRTDLLNLPEQSGFPNSITWPTKPT